MSQAIHPAVRRQTIADALRRTAIRLPTKTGAKRGRAGRAWFQDRDFPGRHSACGGAYTARLLRQLACATVHAAMARQNVGL